MISIQEFVIGLGFLQPTTHKQVSIKIYTKFHTLYLLQTLLSSFFLLFSSSSLPFPLLLSFPLLFSFSTVLVSQKMRDQLLISNCFVKAMFGLCIFTLFFSFLHLSPFLSLLFSIKLIQFRFWSFYSFQFLFHLSQIP